MRGGSCSSAERRGLPAVELVGNCATFAVYLASPVVPSIYRLVSAGAVSLQSVVAEDFLEAHALFALLFMSSVGANSNE